MRRFGIAAAIGAAVVLPTALTPLEADDPVGTSVTFNREIIRIIQRKCEPCHAPAGLAMSLSDFRDARAWGRAIREELVEHRMPPAILARGYGDYETDPSLNAREMATFLTWLDGGMPRGDDADRPVRLTPPNASSEPGASEALHIALPEQTVPARQDLVVRRVVVDAGTAEGHSIARLQFQPGNLGVVRAALVFATSTGASLPADGPGSLIGAWLPWQHAVVPPADYAFKMPARASLVVDLYYRGGNVAQTDRSSLQLVFAPDRAARPVADVVVEPFEETSSRFRGRVQLREATRVWAIHCGLDASVASIELRVERPDKSVEILLWVPTVRPEWPLALVMREPVSLPAGSVVSFVAEKIGNRSDAAPRVTLGVMR